MTDILFIYGTRPEAIKIGPVVAELRHIGRDPKVLATGQHWDLLKGSPAETDLADGESLGLDCSKLELVRCTAKFTYELSKRIKEIGPKVVVVQGDTTSACCAVVGVQLLTGEKPLVAHIEAGVRSFDMEDPWPEEHNRTEITKFADYHYAPTGLTFENLIREGVERSKIEITGNSVVSALARYTGVSQEPATNVVLVTMHRRNIQTEAMVAGVALGLADAAAKFPELEFVWPVHPGVGRFLGQFSSQANLQLVPPKGYHEFIKVLAKAKLVLTDSGGVVEEAATLGIPTAIMRERNDRIEAESVGIARRFPLVAGAFTAGVEWGLTAARRPTNVFGTADAAQRIASHLVKLL